MAGHLPPVRFPFLSKEEFVCSPGIISSEHTYSDGMRLHPVTGTSKTHCLYNRFYNPNTKVDVEWEMRAVKHCPDLRGLLNTETAEQHNRRLEQDLYILNMTSPISHVLIVQKLTLMNNRQTNRQLEAGVRQRLGDNMDYDSLGYLVRRTVIHPGLWVFCVIQGLAIWPEVSWSTLVQLMTCCVLSSKPLLELMQSFYLHTWENTYRKISNIRHTPGDIPW